MDHNLNPYLRQPNQHLDLLEVSRKLLCVSSEQGDPAAYVEKFTEALQLLTQVPRSEHKRKADDCSGFERRQQGQECLMDLEEIESLVGRKADPQLKKLVFDSTLEERRNAIAALKEALAENRVASPIGYIKHAIRGKWTPNYQKSVA